MKYLKIKTNKMRNLDSLKQFTLIAIFVSFVVGAYCILSEFIPERIKTESTTLIVKNEDTTSVIVYLTLGGVPNNEKSKWVQSVKGIFGINNTGLVGKFVLGAHDSVCYTPAYNKGIQGNICFNTQSSQCDGDNPGTTVVEFCLNNYGTIKNAQETVDISCVSGITYIASVDFKGGKGVWTANEPGYDTIIHIQNDTMGMNTNLVGVYPYGCDDCVKVAAPPTCTIDNHETPSALNICQVQRNSSLSGGTVKITYIKSN
jgi:hypothetical protein